MSFEKITCNICGEQTNIIQKHLRDCHGDGSEQPCTIEEYREKFPEAPLMSEYAARIFKERQAQNAGATKVVEVKKNNTLRELFDLTENGTKTASGKDIKVTVLDSSEHDCYVPAIDQNYCFDLENLKTCLMGIETNMNTYVYGHAGVGKSTLIEQICARTHRPLVRLQHTVMTEESHIVGQWTVRAVECPETGKAIQKTVFELGLLPLAMKHGWVFMADEFDRCPSSVSSVYQAVLEGKALVIKEADHENRIIEPHPNFRFVATGNTNGSGDETGLYQATMQQDAASMERFAIVIRQGYMEKDLETAVIQGQAKIKKTDAKKIVDFCHMIRERFPNDISITIGPRVAINIAKIGINKGDYSKGVELAYANRLPEAERKSALEVAQRVFGAR